MARHRKALKRDDTLLIIIDVQKKLASVMKYREQIIRNICKLIKGCQILDIPILLTEQYPKGLGRTEKDILDALNNEVTPIEKMTFSCWDTSEFVDEVREAAKNNIILTGIEAHVCVYQTAMDLLASNYNLSIPIDCVGSRHGYNYEAGINRMREMGAGIYTLEMVLFELTQRSDIPEFKEISKLVK